MTLPDIPRLYTALAEVLAVLVYAQAAPPRAAKPVTYAATAGYSTAFGTAAGGGLHGSLRLFVLV